MNDLNYEIDPFLEQALAEHHELHREVSDIEALLDNTTPDDGRPEAVMQAVNRVDCLLEKLKHHFAQEEAGGYMEDAIARLPSLASSAAVLQQQHAELTRLLGLLSIEAKAAASPSAAWKLLRQGFKTCAKKLLAHEGAENSMLQRAYNVDLGME